MTDIRIPQCDPKAAYLAQKQEIDAAIARVLARGRYILGEEVAAFEHDFAAYIGCRHGIGVASGTDALVLALRAIGVTEDDYVVTVSHTAVATVAAIELVGAKPLLIDIDPVTCTMDATEFARVLAAPPGRVACVIPVHLYGQAAELDATLPLARRHGVRVIEDCAQSNGAMLGGKRLGTFGDLSAFSFYPTKNLGAVGDGGIVLTDDEGLAERLRALREYGWRERYVSEIAGMNSRLDELQAAVLQVKLKALDHDNARRAEIAAAYDEGLGGLPLTLPARRAGGTHVFHQYVVRSTERDRLRDALTRRGIGTNIHYPVPVHSQKAYQGRLTVGPSGLAESERAAREVLSLPIYPQLGLDRAAEVVAAIQDAMRA